MSRKAKSFKYMDEVKYELELRRYSQNTIKHYLCSIRRFCAFFNKDADELGENEIRQYLYHCISLLRGGGNYANSRHSYPHCAFGRHITALYLSKYTGMVL